MTSCWIPKNQAMAGSFGRAVLERTPMPTQSSDELSTAEAARELGITTQAVSRAIRDGRLKARLDQRPGTARGAWKITKAALAAWHPVTDRYERLRMAQAKRWPAVCSDGPNKESSHD